MKFFTNKPILAVLTLLAFSSLNTGCASHAYRCDLDEDGSNNPNCKSPVEIYQAAVKGGGDRISIFDKNDSEFSGDSVFPRTIKVVKPIHQQELETKFSYQQQYKPKFIPPQVHRVWFPAYRDDFGYLHREDVVYYKVPGRFVAGNLNERGIAMSASSDMGPTKPDELGVQAKIVEKNNNKPNNTSQSVMAPSPSMMSQGKGYPLNMGQQK